METLAVDALGVRQGKPSILSEFSCNVTCSWLTSCRPREIYYRPRPPIELFPIFPLLTSPSILYKFVLQQVRRSISILRPKQRRSTDPWIIAITEMLSDLKNLALAVQPSIVHNLVILSYPDFEAGTNHIYKDRFLIACDQAGLEQLSNISKVISQAALEYYNIVNCEDDTLDPLCRGSSDEQISTVLTVTYNEASLGTTLLNRWLGMLILDRVGENFNHGASSLLRSEDEVRYWEEVEGFIEEAIEDSHVDHLMILGSHATDINLLNVISKVLERCGSGKSWGKYSIRSGTAEEYLFAAARGDAQIARRGMISGFDACLVPETCKQPEPEQENADAVLVDRKSEL